MQSNSYTGDGIQGEITGKVEIDTDELDRRGADSGDAMFGGKVYPHGGNPDNLKVIRGELLFGHKDDQAAVYPMAWSSFNGKTIHDSHNEEVLKRRIVFRGIAKGDFMYGGDNYDGREQGQNPIGAVLAGSVRVENKSGKDIHAGTPLEWEIPYFNTGSSLTEHNSPAYPYSENGFSQAPGKLIGYFKPADYTDYALEIDMVRAMSKIPNSEEFPGIEGLGPEDLLEDDKRRLLTPDQEEALGIKYGALGLMALGAFLASQGTSPQEILADANGDFLAMFTDMDVEGIETDSQLGKVTANIVSIMMGGINAARCVKQSRVVATAASTAGPKEDMTIILR